MKIAIFGASGLGREVADICIEIGYSEIVFLAGEPEETHDPVNRVMLDTLENVNKLTGEGFKFAIAIGNSAIRKKIVEKYPDIPYPNIVHPSASFGSGQRESIDTKRGNIVTAGCRLTNNISFGNFVYVNCNTTIGHDCVIEDFVSLMTGSTISGNVHIKEGAYIGANSSIIQGRASKKVLIGRNSTVGMGAVVLRNVKDNTTVFGNPAKKISFKD